MSVRVLLEVTGEGGGAAALLCSSCYIDRRQPCMHREIHNVKYMWV